MRGWARPEPAADASSIGQNAAAGSKIHRPNPAAVAGRVDMDLGADDRDTAEDEVTTAQWRPGGNGMADIEIGEYALDGSTAGAGPPLLFLHGGDYVAQNSAVLDRLAGHWRVTAPRHPGFGHSERPEGFRTVHDLAYLYLDWLDRERAGGVVVVGSSLGGWIALEMCVRSVEKVGALVLIDTLGVKFGGREERDIADVYALPEDELRRRTFFDPQRVVPDYAALGDGELTAIARDRQATALYGWRPYMHDPGLRQWLHRVRVPTLVLWGEHDGIVSPDYGEKLTRALPDARFERIAQAGHYPQVECPDAVADAIERFVGERFAGEHFAGTEARR
jgi:pimeloyl-ACP methyl ester carboxylesterase